MRERGIILALLAGLGAITYHSSTSDASKTPENLTGAQSVARESRFSEEELATTLARFDKRRSFEIRVSADGPCEVKIRSIADGAGGPSSFDWVMAIVPDPERSNLRLSFDRDIEVIQLAAASAGYQYERFWLPWSTAPPAKESSYVIRPEPTDTKAELHSVVIAPEKDDRERLPGVLLFRNGAGRPLAFFLVGETPYGGHCSRRIPHSGLPRKTARGIGWTPRQRQAETDRACILG